MAYSFFIKREGYSSIAVEEWMRIVNDDPEMRFATIQVSNPLGQIIEVAGEADVEWLKHPEKRRVYFMYYNGKISLRAPDAPTLTKARFIAHQLNARVQGEEGEFYD